MNRRKIATIAKMKRAGFMCWAIAARYGVSIDMVVAALVESGVVSQAQWAMRLKSAQLRKY